MAWIEFHDDIWEHHKTERFADMIGVPVVYAVGHLASLWHFVLRNAWKDANLEPWGDKGIERAARWVGEQGKMVKALRECGFLDGSVAHGWTERAGRLVLDRIYNEEKRKTKVYGENHRKPLATQPNPTQPYPTQPNHLTTANDAPSAVDYSQVRITLGSYKQVYVTNIPVDECEVLLRTPRLGQQYEHALKWRIAQKQAEMTPAQRAKK